MDPGGREGADSSRPAASGRGVSPRGRETALIEGARYIPFNRPHVVGTELAYVREAIENSHLSGNGPFTARCTELLERELGASRVLLTHSCTGALEMSVLLAGIGPSDEVIVPSFAFPSLANAVALRGATPVFVDIRSDTLNLDERLVEESVTPQTKAIAPIDYAGVGSKLDAFLELAGAHDLVVLEDAAQGYGASYRGRPLGSLADLACLSFHETKNVMCGEGGALIVNRPEWVERAEIVHEKGTNRSAFFRGQVEKYTWVDLGSSYVVSDINAAFLWAQLEGAEEITISRRAIWNAYHAGLAELEAQEKIRRPVVPAECEHNAHMYYVLLARGADRDTCIERFASADINAVFHYVPLHSSPAGKRLGRTQGSLAVTDDVSERLVRLPLWVGMSDSEIDRVVAAVHDSVG
jgi:dTDP-4-amino-4,6-dideoxygalactose transaminase